MRTSVLSENRVAVGGGDANAYAVALTVGDFDFDHLRV
jgi:hypothetical protein